VIGLWGFAGAAEKPDPVVDPDMMSERMSLHGLDEQGVVDRLACEQAAAELQGSIRTAAGPGDNDLVQPGCSAGTWVTVDLDVQNPYGTHAQNWVFPCPSGPSP